MDSHKMLERYGPWALIAGGSEGIGSELADRLAQVGFKLILVARKPVPLEETAASVRQKYGTEVLTLPADLTSPETAIRLTRLTDGLDVGLLIYNAGAESKSQVFLGRPIEDSERIVALNVSTPMRLIHKYGAAMCSRGRGGIVVCSSLASLAGVPGMGHYSGAKAFMNLFLEALWEEIGPKGVDVCSAILPLVRTPAAKRMGLQFDNEQIGVAPSVIADEILEKIGNGPAFHAGGSDDIANHLRTLPRDEAVQFIVQMSKSANSAPKVS